MIRILFGMSAILDYIKDNTLKVMCSLSELYFAWSYLYFNYFILYTRYSLQNWYLSEELIVSKLTTSVIHLSINTMIINLHNILWHRKGELLYLLQITHYTNVTRLRFNEIWNILQEETFVIIHIQFWLEDLKIVLRRYLYHLYYMGSSVRMTVVHQFIYYYMGYEVGDVHSYISSILNIFSLSY